MHGTASAAQGAPGSPRLPQGQPGQRFAIVQGLLFGFEGPSSLRFFDTLDAEKRVLQDDNLSRFAQPASLGL